MNVQIRPYELADAQSLARAAVESHREISPWMPWCHAQYTLQEAQTWIELTIRGRQEGSLYDFAIVIDGEFVGACGINQVNTQDRVANLGYWLRSSVAGKGIAAIAAQQVIDWAFQNTELNRIEIVTAIDNHRSQRVAEKLGAQRDAVLQQRTMVKGQPSPAILYSVVRNNE
ncbi:MAG: GNAT family N-acetyltransferase [Pseudomonadales bacterium]